MGGESGMSYSQVVWSVEGMKARVQGVRGDGWGGKSS